MSVKTEVDSLRHICMQVWEHGNNNMEISTFIYYSIDDRTNHDCIELDIYSRNRAATGDISRWNPEQYEEQRLMLPIKNRNDFRCAYRLARLVRGRPRSREVLLHWRTYG